MTVFSSTFWNLYDKINKIIKSIGFRIQKHIDDSNAPLDAVKLVSHSKILPWKLLNREIDTSSGIEIYTDGSKDKLSK